ncbi:hypothetical protein DK52_1569 [Brucella abortus]|nr:hypothetical protein DK52_1569 [Brucella abortus]
MRRDRGGARLLYHGGGRLVHFEIQVGCLHGEACAFGLQKHIRQNWNRVAALHDAMDVVERFKKVRSL